MASEMFTRVARPSPGFADQILHPRDERSGVVGAGGGVGLHGAEPVGAPGHRRPQLGGDVGGVHGGSREHQYGAQRRAGVGQLGGGAVAPVALLAAEQDVLGGVARPHADLRRAGLRQARERRHVQGEHAVVPVVLRAGRPPIGYGSRRSL
ncbi:hypothetical protein GCM10023259_025220 [Thermocatellispora tengchongensis]